MMKLKNLGLVFILGLPILAPWQLAAQLEIDGGSPGIKVINANVAGDFNGIAAGIRATNSFIGTAIDGTDNSSSTSSNGVKGSSTVGKGVFGESSAGVGVFGMSDTHYGVQGVSTSSVGVRGTSDSGTGGYFSSSSVAAQLKGHLKLESLSNDHNWQIEINSALNDGYLLLYYKGAFRGSFNSTNGNYASVSDGRSKQNIQPIKDGVLQDINAMTPVSYEMKDQNDDERTYGLVAQELQQILPAVVQTTNTEGDSLFSISYSELIPILIKGMQEQQELIEALSSQVHQQQNQILQLINQWQVRTSKSNVIRD